MKRGARLSQCADSVRQAVEQQYGPIETLAGVSKSMLTIHAEDEPWERKEIDFQHKAEDWLTSIGFAKRNKGNILSAKERDIGAQIHVARAIGNPYLLDILLLRHDGHFLEIELKTGKGKLSDIQAALCGAGKPVCRSMGELKRIVEEWMKGAR